VQGAFERYRQGQNPKRFSPRGIFLLRVITHRDITIAPQFPCEFSSTFNLAPRVQKCDAFFSLGRIYVVSSTHSLGFAFSFQRDQRILIYCAN
jgi:hypothetical protein